MAIVQSDSEAMAIINCNEEALSYMLVPSTHQRVEWIHSDWNQRIDLWFAPTSAMWFYCDINASSGAFGSSNGANGKTIFDFKTSGTTRLCWNWDTDTRNYTNNWRHVWVIDYYNHKLWYDDTLVTISNPSTWYPSQTFSLTHWKEQWTYYYWLTAYMYWYKIYKNGELYRNLIPCYRKSDNVIWLRDAVNKQFYTNSGSGSFTKWPNV